MPPYVEPGYTANDVEDEDLTSQVSVTFFKNDGGSLIPVSSINTAEIGEYQVNYSVVDSQNNTTVESRIVNVISNTVPVIILTGSAVVTIDIGGTYVEPGYTANDVEDGNLTASVAVTGVVDTNTVGTYILTYSVVDSHDNIVTATRTVNVIANNSPVITLIGPASIDVNIGDTFVDPGYTAIDIEDGDLTSLVSVAFFKTINGGSGGNVVPSIDTSTAGQYLISYTVEDSDGSTYVIHRAVNVIAPSFRSVVFDIADNWGNSTLLGIRSIEFKLNGVLITLTGPAGYATTMYNSLNSPVHPFSNPPKTGFGGGWLAADGTVQNQRLQVVFSSTLQFDEIVINNAHNNGLGTDWGARNIVITGSTDEITDTTYGASIANSSVLFDGELAQHVTSDVADDQVIWTA